jgi:hypothetical protein
MDALLGRVYAHRTHAVQSTTLSNGTAERWVGSCRREILDHVIVLNEEHLRRLIRGYVTYHHQDRIHDSLMKDTPNQRPVEPKPTGNARLDSIPRLGGLHPSLLVARCSMEAWQEQLSYAIVGSRHCAKDWRGDWAERLSG